MNSDGASAFWSWSNSVYRQVGDSCLTLQDTWELDVNILLFCCWCGTHGRVLDEDDVRRIEGAVAPWRSHVILRLRDARRWMKDRSGTGPVKPLRRRILEVELEAEREEQRLMVEAAHMQRPGPGAGPGLPVAAGNLRNYLKVRGVASEEVLSQLRSLLAATCPGCSDREISRVLAAGSG